MTDQDTNSLEKILDDHATVYARSTIREVGGEITEAQRLGVWADADKKAKEQMESYVRRRTIAARSEEIQNAQRVISGQWATMDQLKELSERLAALDRLAGDA